MQEPADTQVPTRTVQFAYLDSLEVTIRPAVLDLNPLFVVACQVWLAPLKLAAQLPDDHPRALTDERATAALAKAYGMAVCVGSSSMEMDDYTPEQWEAWLLEHPEEFGWLQDVAPIRTNFLPAEEVQEPGAVGALKATPDPTEALQRDPGE